MTKHFYKCLACGNTKNFVCDGYTTNYHSVLVNNQGEFLDTLEDYDSETEINYDSISCFECGSNEVDWISNERDVKIKDEVTIFDPKINE